MQLTDCVRGVPHDVWALFEPILPTMAWQGNGRKPIKNRRCLHALLYLLASGIGWEYLSVGFPSTSSLRSAGWPGGWTDRLAAISAGSSWPPG